MLTIPPVPARRHDPALQNFVYKGETDAVTRRKDQEHVARLARKVRQALAAARRTNAD